MTKENKNWSSLKNFAPKLNLNHNIYIEMNHSEWKSFSNNNCLCLLSSFFHFCSLSLFFLLFFTCKLLLLQKELFKSAMEVCEDNEKGDEIATPTDPNVSYQRALTEHWIFHSFLLFFISFVWIISNQSFLFQAPVQLDDKAKKNVPKRKFIWSDELRWTSLSWKLEF